MGLFKKEMPNEVVLLEQLNKEKLPLPKSVNGYAIYTLADIKKFKNINQLKKQINLDLKIAKKKLN